jgi:hypothetical protein
VVQKAVLGVITPHPVQKQMLPADSLTGKAEALQQPGGWDIVRKSHSHDAVEL